MKGVSTRALIAGDSQVALVALLKGRSSSKALNKELQSSLGWYLGGGLQPQFAYFPTDLNPADDPTRSLEVREPKDEPVEPFAEWRKLPT